MGVSIRGEEALNSILFGLEQWTRGGLRSDTEKGVKDMTSDYTEKILRGQGADGAPLASLKKSTLEGPVRRDGRTEIRNLSYGDTPLNASGNTARSLTYKKIGFDQWEISSRTDIGDKILHSNANTTHHGNPFGGDTPKVIRDPVQVTDTQMDILEHHLLNGLDKALNG